MNTIESKQLVNNKVNRHLLLYALTFARQSVKTTGCNTLLHCRSLITNASVKFANALSITQATIVLSDFGRSWSVDWVHLILSGSVKWTLDKSG